MTISIGQLNVLCNPNDLVGSFTDEHLRKIQKNSDSAPSVAPGFRGEDISPSFPFLLAPLFTPFSVGDKLFSGIKAQVAHFSFSLYLLRR